jgi:hypothetical protein
MIQAATLPSTPVEHGHPGRDEHQHPPESEAGRIDRMTGIPVPVGKCDKRRCFAAGAAGISRRVVFRRNAKEAEAIA